MSGPPPAAGAGRCYAPREDTGLLLPFADGARPGGRFLDLGTGSGLLLRAAARAGARAVGTDLNPHALRAARAAAPAGVDLVRTDLARGLGRFERILVNPPYLPTPPGAEDPDRWHHLALDGGPDGLETTRRVLACLPRHLTPRGRAYLLVSSLQPRRARATLARRWRSRGGRWRVVAHRDLEGERLEVVELRRPSPGRALGAAGSPRRTGIRRRAPGPVRASGSSRGRAGGRRNAPGAASVRRRSPGGS